MERKEQEKGGSEYEVGKEREEGTREGRKRDEVRREKGRMERKNRRREKR